jgi:hypothetical protein
MSPMPEMFEDRDDHMPSGEYELSQLIGTIGNLYVRRGLCPPSQLKAALKGWRGLSIHEIVEVVERHLEEHQERFRGSGDGLFPLLEAELRKTLAAKSPALDRPIAKPQSRRRRVVQVHTASGVPDLLIDDPSAPMPTEKPSPASPQLSALPGFESSGRPIGEDGA